MTLPSAGALALSAVQTQLGGTNPVSMSEYYEGGPNVFNPTTGTNGEVPEQGSAFPMSKLYGTSPVSWVTRLEGYDFDTSTKVRLDSGNNLYVAGYSQSEDPTQTIFALEVAKYGNAGNVIWKKAFGKDLTLNIVESDLCLDSSNNVYVVGYYTHPTTRYYVGLLIKYSTDGALLWQRSVYPIPGATGEVIFKSVVVDSSGNVYVAGYTTISGYNLFLTKFDSSGTLVWQKSYDNATGSEVGYKITADSSGNLYVTGAAASNPPTSTDYNLLVMKLNASGEIVWQKNIGNASGSYSEVGRGIVLDSSNNVYVAGSTSSPSGYKCLVVKLDTDGNVLWQKSFTDGTNNFYGFDIALDGSNNSYICGYYYGGADLGGFILKLDSSGSIIWQRTLKAVLKIGTVPETVYLNGVAVGLQGIYVCGQFISGCIISKLPLDGSATGSAGYLSYSTLSATLSASTLPVNNGALSGSAGTMLTVDPGLSSVDSILINYPQKMLPPYWIEDLGSTNQTTQFTITDDKGNVYFLGTTSLIKVNSAGTVKWSKRFAAGKTVTPQSCRFDTAGNILVVGAVFLTAGVNTQSGYVIKFDPNGNVLWKKTLTNNVVNASIVFYGVDVDTNNNVYVVGLYKQPGSDDSTVVAKYSSTGSLVWQKRIYQAILSLKVVCYCIAVDRKHSNNIVLCGVYLNRAFWVQIDVSGVLGWQKSLSGGSSQEQLSNIVFDNGSGNFYMAGYISESGSLRTFMIRAAGSTGVLSYSMKVVAFPSSANELASSIVYNESDRLMIGGYETDTGQTYALSIALDSSTFLWQRKLNGYGPTRVTFDTIGNVYWNMYNTIAKFPASGDLAGTYGSYTYASITSTITYPDIAVSDMSTSITTITATDADATDAVTDYAITPSITTVQ